MVRGVAWRTAWCTACACARQALLPPTEVLLDAWSAEPAGVALLVLDALMLSRTVARLCVVQYQTAVGG